MMPVPPSCAVEQTAGSHRSPRLLTAGVLYGNILPITWSLMLALPARGVGAAWTTIVFKYEKEVAELLQIPANMTPGALLPVAYFKATISSQRRASRRVSVLIGTHGDPAVEVPDFTFDRTARSHSLAAACQRGR